MSRPAARTAAIVLLVFRAVIPVGAADAGPVDGRKIFVRNCAPCHGPDGRARSPAARKLGVKDLTQNRLEDDQIRTQILQGIQAKGQAGKMPAFKDSFSDDELRALVVEVKRLRAPAKAGAR